MKVLIVISALLAITLARPSDLILDVHPHGFDRSAIEYRPAYDFHHHGFDRSAIEFRPAYDLLHHGFDRSAIEYTPAYDWLHQGFDRSAIEYSPAYDWLHYGFDRSAIEYRPTYPLDSRHTIQSQYHAQDTSGQYSFGYETPESSRKEIGAIDGSSHGTYSYFDANGKLQTVNYRADENGFNVAATNLPVQPKALPIPALIPVVETPEVMKAREEHLNALARAEAGEVVKVEAVTDEPIVAKAKADHQKLVESGEFYKSELLPITETPEVKKAREEHLKELAKAETGEYVKLEAVTDEPIVAKAKEDHLNLKKVIEEHDKIYKTIAPVHIYENYHHPELFRAPYAYPVHYTREYVPKPLGYLAHAPLPIVSPVAHYW